jgi:hypothetical protein
MRDQNAQALLAKVMNWEKEEDVISRVPSLQLLADYKYDHYQRFGPGRRFVESLALWLDQFNPSDRNTALNLVLERLIYFSEAELLHLVQTAYPDLIVQERLRLVAGEQGIPAFRVGQLRHHQRFKELQLKTLYLGLSDGARTNEIRRSSAGEIGNEQIWQAYELGEDKASEMAEALKTALDESGYATSKARFNLIWLLDDFSGSGNTYIRFDSKQNKFKGKIKKVYERLNRGDLIDTSHYEVFLLLYVATRKAIDHISYWAERFTSENGYKPLQIRVLCPVEDNEALTRGWTPSLEAILTNAAYYDHRSFDKHIAVGGTTDAQLGFAACALPVVLSHNTPNNSVYILWGSDTFKFIGLFPRMSRHREF